MKIKTREEYIAAKNAKEQKYLKKIISSRYIKAYSRHIKHIINSATRVLARRINKIDTFEEPRTVDFNFNFNLFSLRFVSTYRDTDFVEILNNLEKIFPYLDIRLDLYNCSVCSCFRATISLKAGNK